MLDVLDRAQAKSEQTVRGRGERRDLAQTRRLGDAPLFHGMTSTHC